MFDFSVVTEPGNFSRLVDGVLTMLELSIAAWMMAIILALGLTLLRSTDSKILQGAVRAYVEFHQNVPVLVQIMLWYFGMPALLPMDAQVWINSHNSEFVFSFIAIALAMSAYFSEDLRSGIRAIPHSQYEASRSLGLSFLKTARYVIFPQAYRSALPSLVNHTVLLYKNTSLAMAVGVAELTYVAREIESNTFKTVEIYLITTVIYLAISILIMGVGSCLENKVRVKAR